MTEYARQLLAKIELILMLAESERHLAIARKAKVEVDKV